MSNKWLVVFMIFWFTAFCQFPFSKAKAEYENYPNQTPLLEKISEAQKIALDKLTIFEEILRAENESKTELKILNSKRKHTAKEKTRVKELQLALLTLTELKTRSLNKTLLIALNRETGALHEIYIQEPEYKKNKREPINNEYRSYDKNCSINKIGGNGHGKSFLTLCNNNVLSVLALAHFHEKESKKSRGIEHFYTPYSSSFHDAEIIAQGKIYLPQIIKTAAESLREKSVPSLAYPGEFVHEKLSPHFTEAIIVNEHMDHDEFAEAIAREEERALTANNNDKKNRRSEVLPLIEKVFIVLGTNRERAYIFSVSKARACCFAQFIPSTYHTVRKAYPKAKLPKDFFEAMRDHTIATQAMFLLFDYDTSQFSSAARELCESSQELLEDCLAVSYNGGVNRLNGVIQTYGENWDLQKTVRRGKRFIKKGLTEETHIYLQKIRKIREIIQ